MGRFTSKVTQVYFEDAVGTRLEITPGPGDFTVDNLTEGNAQKQSGRNRGRHDCWVEGDDLIQAWSITRYFKAESATSTALARVLDWIHRTGIYAPAGTTPLVSVDSSEWSYKIYVSMNDGTNVASCTLPNAVAMAAFAEGTAPDGHALTINGENVVAPVWT